MLSRWVRLPIYTPLPRHFHTSHCHSHICLHMTFHFLLLVMGSHELVCFGELKQSGNSTDQRMNQIALYLRFNAYTTCYECHRQLHLLCSSFTYSQMPLYLKWDVNLYCTLIWLKEWNCTQLSLSKLLLVTVSTSGSLLLYPSWHVGLGALTAAHSC